MKTGVRLFAAAVALLLSTPFAFAQPAAGPQTQDSLVKEALARYQAGLEALQKGPAVPQPSVGAPQSRGTRELRLSEVVQLALEKNLDISVERLNPQGVDLQIAAIKNQFLPVATSTIGTRDQMRLPNSLLNGGQRVNNGTRTFNFGFTQDIS